MNWTIIYLLDAIRWLVSKDDYIYWEHFVVAGRIFCQPYITFDDVTFTSEIL